MLVSLLLLVSEAAALPELWMDVGREVHSEAGESREEYSEAGESREEYTPGDLINQFLSSLGTSLGLPPGHPDFAKKILQTRTKSKAGKQGGEVDEAGTARYPACKGAQAGVCRTPTDTVGKLYMSYSAYSSKIIVFMLGLGTYSRSVQSAARVCGTGGL